MPKFRKKPVEIEAVLWNGVGFQPGDIPSWLREASQKEMGVPGSVVRTGNEINIHTLEGIMVAKPDDWIIRGVKGELYPCKPDIFETSYEAV